MLYAIVALIALIADQALKYYVTLNIPYGEGVMTFIPGVMSLVHHRNTGAAFSMLSGGSARWAFVLLAVCFTAAVIYMISHRTIRSKLLNWAMVLVAAGAVGNAIDRALFGYVVDMFRTDFMNFAIFNIADIFITVGGFGLCLGILLTPDKKDEVPAYGEDNTEPRQENVTAIKLFNTRLQPPEEVQERRRSGKLYGDKKPVDPNNPFAEFEQMPTTLTPPKKPAPTAEELLQEQRDADAADAQVQQIKDELSLEAILNEFGDGTD